MTAALEVRDVWAGYGGLPVLRGVSLTVDAGEVVGLIGPNGSGKTTLVRVASRGLRPERGTVRLLGQDPYTLRPRAAARQVAVVPQEIAPGVSFTVLETVLLGRSPYLSPWAGGGPEDWAHARRAMERANVQHLADRPLDRLSGGERQRVVLAQALAQDAPVLLLDEPTTHLDLHHVLDVLTVVGRLARREGRAALAVFHDLNLAAASCDRLVALAVGEVVAAGTPEEVISRALLAEVYGVEAEVIPHPLTGRPTVILGGTLPAAAPVPGSPRAHVVGGAGRGAPLMRALAERGYEVTAGVLHATDTDAVVAERLNLLRVTVPPFSPIDPAAAEECLALARTAEVIYLLDAPYGPGNVENLRVVREAQRAGRRVVVLEQVPIGERDFTRGEATRLWEEIGAHAERVRTYEELLARAAAKG